MNNQSISPGQTVMGCVRVAIPAGVTVSGTPTVLAQDPPIPPGTARSWSAPITIGGALTTVRTGAANPNDIDADGRVTLTFTATIASAGSPEFTTTVFGQQNCTGQAFFLSGSQPSVARSAPVVNDAPVCADDSGSTPEDVQLDDTLACTDVDGDTLTYAEVAGPSNGTLTLNPDGSFSYLPDPDFNGTDSFTFVANDGSADSNVATYTVTVTPVNDAPVCADDSGSTPEDVQLDDTLACTDVDGDTLTYAEVAGPSNGTLTLNPDGSFSYLPDPDFNGTDSFTFVANDGSADSNEGTFTITVGPGNDAPVLDPIGPQTTAEGSAVSFTATASDGDVPPDTLTFSTSGAPSGATIDPNTGAFTWTPPNDGVFTFDVCVSDGSLEDCQPVTVTVTNVAPTVVLSGPASATAGQTLTYTYTISDPGADTHVVTESCGANAVLVDTPAANSFDCQFTTGPATTTVSVVADDGGEPNGLGLASADVTVAAAPVPSPTPTPSTDTAPGSSGSPAPSPSAGAGAVPDTAMPASVPLSMIGWIVGMVLLSCLALAIGARESATTARRPIPTQTYRPRR